MDLEVGEKLFLRAWRWTPEQLRIDALKDKTILDGDWPGYYSISSFGLAREPGETVDELKGRLIRAFLAHRSTRWAAFATERELANAGFTPELSEPPPDHYNVPVGLNEEELEVDALASVFALRDREKIE